MSRQARGQLGVDQDRGGVGVGVDQVSGELDAHAERPDRAGGRHDRQLAQRLAHRRIDRDQDRFKPPHALVGNIDHVEGHAGRNDERLAWTKALT
ncbi:hypothetical protein ACRAWD_18290 [Caulobacter segnis]